MEIKNAGFLSERLPYTAVAACEFLEHCVVKETLINCLRVMKRKAHGADGPGHIQKYVEVTSTAQRSDSPAQVINQCFLNGV